MSLRNAPIEGLRRVLGLHRADDGAARPEERIEGRARQSGQGMLEYALAIVLVAVIVLIIIAVLGTSTGNMFSNVVYNI